MLVSIKLPPPDMTVSVTLTKTQKIWGPLQV